MGASAVRATPSHCGGTAESGVEVGVGVGGMSVEVGTAVAVCAGSGVREGMRVGIAVDVVVTTGGNVDVVVGKTNGSALSDALAVQAESPHTTSNNISQPNRARIRMEPIIILERGAEDTLAA